MSETGDVPLRLTARGPGSRAEIAAYVKAAIEQNTTPNDDASSERLAEGITTSVLHRLGAGLWESVSGATQEDEEARTAPTVQLVVYAEGQIGLAVVDSPDRADEYARNVGGVVVELPVLADYRKGDRDDG